MRKTCCQNKKRDSVSENLNMSRDTPSPCTHMYAFWMTPLRRSFARTSGWTLK